MKFHYAYFLAVLYIGALFSAHQELYQKKPAFYAYMFGSLNSDLVDTQHCADVYITPASCQKIIMTLLAYSFLGVDYQYETKLYRAKESDDVMISFVGDPTITSLDLHRLLESVSSSLGDGKIILDLSLWNVLAFSPYFMGEDHATNYCRPLSPAIINKNGLQQIDVNHTNEQQVIPHNVIEYITKQVALILQSLGRSNEILIIQDPLKLLKEMIFINSIKSKALEVIIPSALKSSDNLIFDCLYFTLINQYTRTQVISWDQGDSVIKKLLKNYLDIEFADARFVDGSGLSRLNKIQLRTLFQILKKGYSVDKFIEALPYPGEHNTTLEKRILLPATLSAKTGTLGGITCLCGYNLTDYDPKLFCFFAQGFNPPLKEMINTIDPWIAKQVNAV